MNFHRGKAPLDTPEIDALASDDYPFSMFKNQWWSGITGSVALAVLLSLGCGHSEGPGQPNTPEQSTPTPTATATPTPTPIATATPTPTATATPTPTPFDPAAILPLVVRDLSQATANTTVNLARLDLDAIKPEHANKVMPWLLECSKRSFRDLPGTGDGQYCPDGILAPGKKIESFTGESAWLTRALRAYLRVRATTSASDRSQIDTWFMDNADFEVVHMNSFLDNNFPNRHLDDYSIKAGNAAAADMVGTRKLTQNGQSISVLSQWYNNRRSVSQAFLALAGVAFHRDYPQRAAPYILEVKRYIKEWVRYSVYASGEQGEWLRNHSYPNAEGLYIESQGLTYGAYNCALALNAALWFYQKLGDRELVDFTTREGLWGSECAPSDPAKSIWTVSNLHIDILAGLQSRINDQGGAINQAAVLYDYPTGSLKNRLLHASWFLPAYRQLKPADPHTASLEAWLSTTNTYLESGPNMRADDFYGLWRNFTGISIDTRTEDYGWL